MAFLYAELISERNQFLFVAPNSSRAISAQHAENYPSTIGTARNSAIQDILPEAAVHRWMLQNLSVPENQPELDVGLWHRGVDYVG